MIIPRTKSEKVLLYKDFYALEINILDILTQRHIFPLDISLKYVGQN